jgi:hypothetical protein
MTPSEVQVYIVLLAHANKDRECWPGVDLIGQVAGLDRKTVMAATKGLNDKGLISKRRGSRDKGNIYTLYPEVPTSGTTDKDSEVPAGGTTGERSSTNRERSEVPFASSQKSRLTDSPLYKEHTKEHTKESVSFFLSKSCLSRHGITGPVLEELADDPHLKDSDADRLGEKYTDGALVVQLRTLRDTRRREAETRAKQQSLEEIFKDPDLLAAVQAAEPNIEHRPIFDHTRSAMCRLARRRGLLPPTSGSNRDTSGMVPILGTTDDAPRRQPLKAIIRSDA